MTDNPSMHDETQQIQNTIISCDGLSKVFDDGALYVEVLKNINLTLAQGEQIAIVGSSGAGKSTLLHLLGGLDTPSQGSVHISGVNINHLSENERCRLRNREVGFVYQFHHLLPEFTALENVVMPLLIGKISFKQASLKALDLLDKVGVAKRQKHKVGELSGGERQRVAIARALVTEPSCLLADEPTGNLDHSTAETVYQTMLALNKELKTSIVIVTHDLELAANMDRVMSLVDGQLSAYTRH